MTEREPAQAEESEASKEMPENKEIERKFLISELPEDLDVYIKKEISQGYLEIYEDGTEVRVRKEDDKYIQAVKKGEGEERGEREISLTEANFNSLWKNTDGKRLSKTRYEIPYNGSKIELDIFHGELEGLVTAEVEFKTREESKNFEVPTWFGKEVTEDKNYKGQSVAVRGIPESFSLDIKEKRLETPKYKLEEGIQKTIELTKEKVASNKDPVIVSIAGGSASGKTSALAVKVQEAFGDDAMILSMDNYYRGKEYMDIQKAKGNEINFDQPEAINIELFREHLQMLKEGKPIPELKYSFSDAPPEVVGKIDPKKIIIVEGLFTLNDSLKELSDVKAFVDISTHGRILRRLLRDIKRTGQKPSDILNYFSKVVEPMHDKYIESSKKNADLIVQNEYNPEIEAERSGLHEVQLKLKGKIDASKMAELGVDRLGTVTQTDHYYYPEGRDLSETGEMLRIRREDGHRILTYKGPKIESKYRERPKFEFEIDEETERIFLSIYGKMVKIIEKERTFYSLDGVIFTQDTVKKMEGSKSESLGDFIEIRSSDGEKIESVISSIGMNEAERSTYSYFDM